MCLQQEHNSVYSEGRAGPNASDQHGFLFGLTRDTRPKLVGELRDKVVVDPILHGAEDDDGPRVVH